MRDRALFHIFLTVNKSPKKNKPKPSTFSIKWEEVAHLLDNILNGAEIFLLHLLYTTNFRNAKFLFVIPKKFVYFSRQQPVLLNLSLHHLCTQIDNELCGSKQTSFLNCQ